MKPCVIFLSVAVGLCSLRAPAQLAATLAVYDAFEVKQGVWPAPLKIEDGLDLRVDDAALQEDPALADEEGQ